MDFEDGQVRDIIEKPIKRDFINAGIYAINQSIHSYVKEKEVVDRMRAKPSTKEYGRLSVICQITSKVEKCFDVNSIRHKCLLGPKAD